MDWTWAAEAGFGDVKHHLTKGEGPGACAGVLLVGSDGAHFQAQHQHWNLTPG